MWNRFEKVIFSPGTILILLLAPWLLLTKTYLQWTPLPSFLPYDSEIFGDLIHLLQGHKIFIPSPLVGMFLGLLVFAPAAIALASFLLTRASLHTLSPKSRLLWASAAFLLILYLTPLGGRLQPSSHLLFFCLFALPFLAPLSGPALWGIATLGGVSVLFHLDLLVFVTWSLFSYLAPLGIHFLIVERGRVARADRKHPLRSVSILLAGGMLILWISAVVASLSLDQLFFEPSRFWYLSILISLLLVPLTLFEPWQSLRWMRLCFFVQGLLFSKAFDIPAAFIGIVLVFELMARVLSRLLPVWTRVMPFLFIVLILVSGALSWQLDRVRNLPWDLRSALEEISDSNPTGIYVFGPSAKAATFLAPVPIFTSSQLILIESEAEFISLLDQQNVSDILIEHEGIEDYWRRRFEDGLSTSAANSSILSRMTTSRMDAIETGTLQLPAIRKIKVEPLKQAPNFIWGKRYEPKL